LLEPLFVGVGGVYKTQVVLGQAAHADAARGFASVAPAVALSGADTDEISHDASPPFMGNAAIENSVERAGFRLNGVQGRTLPAERT